MGSPESTLFAFRHELPSEDLPQPSFTRLPGVIVDVIPPSPDEYLAKRRSNQLIIPHLPYALNEERHKI